MRIPGFTRARFGKPDSRGLLYLEILLGLGLAGLAGLALLELQKPLETLSSRISWQILFRTERLRFLEAWRSALERVEFPWWGPGPGMEIRDDLVAISWKDPLGNHRSLEIRCGSGQSRILLDGGEIFLGAPGGTSPVRFVPLELPGGESPAGLTLIFPDGYGESCLFSSLEAIR